MRFGAQALLAKGMAESDIRVSLERNMQCGIGWCGHCQLGPLLLCGTGRWWATTWPDRCWKSRSCR